MLELESYGLPFSRDENNKIYQVRRWLSHVEYFIAGPR